MNLLMQDSCKKKNVLWHILAPSAVACDNLHLRASAHHRRVSAFLCNREFRGIPYYIKKHRPTDSAPHFMQLAAILQAL